MIRKFAGHDTDTPPGTVVYPNGSVRGTMTGRLSDYVAHVVEQEKSCQYCDNHRCNWMCESALLDAPLTREAKVCYTITTGMSLRDFKDGVGQAYWNRDRETLDRLLESLQNAN